MIRKGSIVKVNATVGFFYSYSPEDLVSDTFPGNEEVLYAPAFRKGITRKYMLRMACQPWVGMVIGWTRKSTGYYRKAVLPVDSYDDNYEQASLDADKQFKVWLVEPLELGSRYTKPAYCNEDDLEEQGVLTAMQLPMDLEE